MLRSHLLSSIRGSVKIEVRGEKVEWFLNRLLHERKEIWNIRRTHSDRMELCIHIADYFQLRPLLKETGCRMTVKERAGFPFWLQKLEQRKMWLFGLFLFVLGLYMLSSIVWDVEVIGNETVDTQTVVEEARQAGIYRYQWKFRLGHPERLSAELTRRLSGVAWVGVRVDGTKVKIEVVESTQPDPLPLVSMRDLVASHDAVVSEIIAEKGLAVVRPYTRVRKGDVLISGTIGDEENQAYVAADGKVTGWVWYEYKLNVPLIHKRKVYTGNTHLNRYLLLGQRALKINGFKAPSYVKSESIRDEHRLYFRQRPLPLGWMDEKVLESTFVEEVLSYEQAKQLALVRAREDISREAGLESRITEEHIVDEQRGEKHLRMTVMIEVEQEIAEERPFLPMESDE